MFLPGNIDSLSIYDIFSYVWRIHVNIQISILIIVSPGRILKNDILICDLLTCKLVNLFISILETIIHFIFRIIFKPGFIQEIARFYNGSLRCTRQFYFLVHSAESVSWRKIFRIFLAIAVNLNSLLNPFEAGIGIVGRLSVGGTIKYLIPVTSQTAQVIDLRKFQERKRIWRLSIMRIDRIKTRSIKDIVITAASHRTDFFQIIVIFKDTHQTSDSALHRSLIYHACICNSSLRAGRF
ncbi:unknown [Firmicutes bacterium CAG:646]|nr:unknown [Firmicutes bacterium CAG:646]